MGNTIFSQKAINNLMQKCVPPSPMIAQGIPKSVKMFYFRNVITLRASLVGNATTSTHLDM